MATYTPNLNLKKPDGNDYVRVSDLNGNMDSLDAVLGKLGNLNTVDKSNIVNAINEAEQNSLHGPYIGENNHWHVWEPANVAFGDTGVNATGPQGPKGDTGPQGPQGQKGDVGPAYIIKGEAYDTLQNLILGVPSPEEGDQYNVGYAPPYHVYRFTGTGWEDQGQNWHDISLYDLAYFGGNPISGDGDTVDNWRAMGLGYAFYSVTDLLTDQPSQWGYLINIPCESEVFQIWNTQPGGPVYTRSGNANGWAKSFTMMYDSLNKPTAEEVGAYPAGAVRAISISLATSAWTGSGPYTAVISQAGVTAQTDCRFELGASVSNLAADITWETGAGTITLTTAAKPTGTISGTAILMEVAG